MTEEQSAAYIQSQSVCALITAMGMQAENQQRVVEGKSPAYVEEDFQKLFKDFEIGYNTVMAYLGPR